SSRPPFERGGRQQTRDVSSRGVRIQHPLNWRDLWLTRCLGRAAALGHWLTRPAAENSLEAFLVSLGVVAVAEIGDKTQLLALLFAARFRAPLSVIGGIFVATVFNHALAAFAGTLIADWLTPQILAWVLAVSFLLMGAW